MLLALCCIEVNVRRKDDVDADDSALFFSVYTTKNRVELLFWTEGRRKKKRTVKLDKTFTGFMIHTDKNSSGNLRNSSKVLV